MCGRRIHARGFTLIELVVVMTIVALLTVLTAPTLASWLHNTRVRTTADYIQNGLRTAQSEAIKQNRLVAFRLTATAPTANGTLPAAAAAGTPVNYWYAATVPWTTAALTSNGVVTNSNQFALVASGIISSDASQVTVQESTGTIGTLCFTPYGRLTGVVSDPTNNVTTCDLPTNAPPKVTYLVKPNTTDANSHPLEVTVTPGGQIRMCDPLQPALPASPAGC